MPIYQILTKEITDTDQFIDKLDSPDAPIIAEGLSMLSWLDYIKPIKDDNKLTNCFRKIEKHLSSDNIHVKYEALEACYELRSVNSFQYFIEYINALTDCFNDNRVPNILGLDVLLSKCVRKRADVAAYHRLNESGISTIRTMLTSQNRADEIIISQLITSLFVAVIGCEQIEIVSDLFQSFTKNKPVKYYLDNDLLKHTDDCLLILLDLTKYTYGLDNNIIIFVQNTVSTLLSIDARAH